MYQQLQHLQGSLIEYLGIDAKDLSKLGYYKRDCKYLHREIRAIPSELVI